MRSGCKFANNFGSGGTGNYRGMGASEQ